MDVEVKYKLVGVGWSECTLSIYGQSCTVTASYLSDALDAFLRSVNYMLAGGNTVKFGFEEEPGEYRWLLSREPNNGLEIRILEFEDDFGWKDDAEGKLIFEAHCPMSEFAFSLARTISELLSEHGVKGYAEKWASGEFPMEQYRSLCRHVGTLPANHSFKADVPDGPRP